MRKNPPKSKVQRVNEAMDSLRRALAMDEPHIAVRLDLGVPDKDTPQGREFLDAVKSFIAAYKKFYGLEHINVALMP